MENEKVVQENNQANLERWATEYCMQTYGTPQFKPFLTACKILLRCTQ